MKKTSGKAKGKMKREDEEIEKLMEKRIVMEKEEVECELSRHC